jgi:hypothetical protein
MANFKITQEDIIKMGIVPIKKEGNEEIVFAISRDEKYVKDMEKLLLDNQSDLPFADLHIIYSPNPNPGYKGENILVVTNPSPEVVSSIVPSPSGEGRYPHLKGYDREELGNKIHDMFLKGKNVWEIAKEFKVQANDIESWIQYPEWKKQMSQS